MENKWKTKLDVPLVVFEQIRNKRSKHQYEKRSRGTRDPESVLPRFFGKSTCSNPPDSRNLFVFRLPFADWLTGELLCESREIGSDWYNRLPRCRTFASWDTRESGIRLSPRHGTTSISRAPIRARSKFSSISCTSSENASAAELSISINQPRSLSGTWKLTDQSARIPPRKTSIVCLKTPSIRSSGISSDKLCR
jgi:hypothetical protein